MRVANDADQAVTMFVRPSDLWTVGVDWGEGPYHFNDMEPFRESRPLGFDSSYGSLGFVEDESLFVSDHLLHESIARLARHKAGPKGANMFGAQHHALVRLLFSVPEALRNSDLQRAVAGVLQAPGSKLDISQYRGNGKALNSWKTWSADDKWPQLGIAVRHQPGAAPSGAIGSGRKRGR